MTNKNNHYFEVDDNKLNNEISKSKKDFHKSFWLMIFILMLLIIGFFLIPKSLYPYIIRTHMYTILIILYIIVTSLGFILRVTIAKKNLYLARGFMWGSIVMVSLPLIALSLAFGACIIYINR